jgi:hypothetical protein
MRIHERSKSDLKEFLDTPIGLFLFNGGKFIYLETLIWSVKFKKKSITHHKTKLLNFLCLETRLSYIFNFNGNISEQLKL